MPIGDRNSSAIGQGGHPHHHLLPHHHHHHHTQKGTKKDEPRASPVALPPPTPPARIVKVQKVIDKAAVSYERRHLGSARYWTKMGRAPNRYKDRTPWASTPVPVPRDRTEGRINCTLTITIGKQYLTRESLEEVVRRRSIWGTGIYTDDSDVIAMAIHMGFLRGAWGSDVDESLLDLGPDCPGMFTTDRIYEPHPSETRQDGPDLEQVRNAREKESALILTAPPADGPLGAMPGKDLKVKVLILPRLTQYYQTACRGLRSRYWGGDHDGMSYTILQLEWVDHDPIHSAVSKKAALKARLEAATRILPLIDAGSTVALRRKILDHTDKDEEEPEPDRPRNHESVQKPK